MKEPPKLLLPAIVFSQFAGTSLWFAGNAIIGDIQPGLANQFAGITSIVQFGFIGGTLAFSLLAIADRFRPSHVFFFSSLIAALSNVLLLALAKDLTWLFLLRFITGFFLAGIYPVGMKIAADCFPQKLGNALGFLVGALVLGTAFPHLLKSLGQHFRWQDVVVFTSILCSAGGLLLLLMVPRYPLRSSGSLELRSAFTVFGWAPFRQAAFGYFGHMWELYALWTFTPILIGLYNTAHGTLINVSFWSFLTIGSGAIGCVAGGLLSRTRGSRTVAFYALLASCMCCAVSFLMFHLPSPVFLSFLLIWGFFATADSPQFSTIVARTAPPEKKGTALTIVTSIGFAITIVSIQLLKPLFSQFKQLGLLLLVIGPVLGLLSIKQYARN